MAEEFKDEASQLLKYDCPPKPNISMEEARVLKELRQDGSRVNLTADNRVAIVVLDKQDCTNKAQDVLTQRDKYIPMIADPTKTQNNLINLLRTIRTQRGLEGTHTMTIQQVQAPKFYRLPKNTNREPLKPVVSSRGVVTYGVIKEPAKILRPLLGPSPLTSGTPNTL